MIIEAIRKGVKKLDIMLNPKPEELRQLEFAINDWLDSPYRKSQKIGELYYIGQHDILHRERTVIGKNGDLVKAGNLPNNRIVDNQYGIHVEKKANYMFGRPISVESKNDKYAAEVRKIINCKFMNTMKSVCTDSMNQKIGWLYVYYADDGTMKFKRFEPYEIMPIWTDNCHDELEKVVRLYDKVFYTEHGKKDVKQYVEIYDKDGIRKYEWYNGHLLGEGELDPYLKALTIVDGEIKDEQSLKWGRIPIIPFKYNHKELDLCSRVKSLQDGINLMLSTFQNNMEEDARSTILVLVNYDGENLGEFREKLAKYGAVKVRSENGGNGDLKTLQVEVKSENYRTIVDLFKKALIQNMRSSDTTELRSQSGGSPNQMNIQSIYSDMDNDANSMETSFQASFDDLLWFINAYLSHKGMDFDDEIKFVLNRDMMQDEALIVQSMSLLGVKVSNRTLLGQLPFINDIDKELEQIDEEHQAELDDYSQTMLNTVDNLGTGND